MCQFIHHHGRLLKRTFFSLVFFLINFIEVNAGSQPPDPGSSPVGGGIDPVGGGAPIGGGFYILMGIALAYLLIKLKHQYFEKQEQE